MSSCPNPLWQQRLTLMLILIMLHIAFTGRELGWPLTDYNMFAGKMDSQFREHTVFRAVALFPDGSEHHLGASRLIFPFRNIMGLDKRLRRYAGRADSEYLLGLTAKHLFHVYRQGAAEKPDFFLRRDLPLAIAAIELRGIRQHKSRDGHKEILRQRVIGRYPERDL